MNIYIKKDMSNLFSILTILLLAVAVMIPRLLFPQFGLLDDGITLRISSQVMENPNIIFSELQSGRFRPVYWVFNWAQYKIFNVNPFGYFLVNLFLLIALSLGMLILLRLFGATIRQAWIGGILIIFSDPIIENFYTLSKSEAAQTFLLVIAIILSCIVVRQKRHFRWWIWFFLTITTLFMSFGFKETTVAIIPVSLCWMFLDFRFSKRNEYHIMDCPSFPFFLAGIVAFLLFIIFRHILSSQVPNLGNYTQSYQINLGFMVINFIRWIDWLLKDFFYVIPVIFLSVMIWKSSLIGDQKKLCGKGISWSAFWLAIFLPWLYTSGYYLLPFSIGVVIFLSTVIESSLTYLSGYKHKSKILVWTGLIAFILFFSLAIGNYITNAQQQIVVDKVNGQLIRFLADSMPRNATLWIDYPENHEYILQMNLLLSEIYNRGDIKIRVIGGMVNSKGALPSHDNFILRNIVSNSVQLSIRLGIYAEESLKRNKDLNGSQILYKNGSSVQNIFFNPSQIICVINTGWVTCPDVPLILDLREFTFGWVIIQ